MFWTPPSIPWLALCLWFIWLGTASWNFLVTSSECQRKRMLEDMLSTFQPFAKGNLVDHVLHTLIMYKDCLGIMKEQCKIARTGDCRICWWSLCMDKPCGRLLRSRWMMMLMSENLSPNLNTHYFGCVANNVELQHRCVLRMWIIIKSSKFNKYSYIKAYL